MSHHRCCCAPATCGTITVTVTGCGGLVLPGATVTLTLGGSPAGSGTTNGSGQVVFTSLVAGTYTVAASKTRFNTNSTTTTINCATTPSRSVSLNLSPATGYVCCTGCPDPYPSTLYLTSSLGSVTLTWAPGYWTGTAVRTIPDAALCHRDPFPIGCVDDGVGSADVTLTYEVTCPASVGGSFTIAVKGNLGGSGGLSYIASDSCNAVCGTGRQAYATTAGGSSCGLPLALSGSFPSTWSYVIGFTVFSMDEPGPDSGTVTVSE